MITLQLNDLNEANLILMALGELPCKTVFELVLKIQTQVREQVSPSVPPLPGGHENLAPTP